MEDVMVRPPAESEESCMHRSRPLPVRGLRVVMIAAVVWSLLALVPGGAEAQDGDPVLVTVNGRGWGHGRGLSQWGAQGYALGVAGQAPWSSAQILDHYYPNTSAANLPQPLRFDVDPNNLRVEIRSSASSSSNEAQIGTPLRFDLEVGTVDLTDIRGVVDVPDIPAGMAGRLSSVTGGMELRIKAGCGGDWNGPDVTVHALPGVVAVDAVPITTAAGSQGLLRVCHNDGSSTWYEGRLRGENVAGTTRTINIVSIEEYLRGVVPREVPSSWQPAALQAQAVAARSYALSGDPRYGSGSFADTCDTTRCQVYGGRYTQVGTTFKATFTATTDAAVAATAGSVRVFDVGGAVARTEFSSSSGGYTLDAAALGGFPAVEDLGDATAANPNKTWSVTLDLTSWVAAQGKGDLLAIEEFDRTGNGPDGGHVLQVRFVFANGTVTMTGEQARAQWRGSPVSGQPGRPTGLLSTWFTFDDSQLDLLTANGVYVDAVYQLFLQRDAAGQERTTAATALAQGSSRYSLTSTLSLSPEWAGVEIDDLYPIVFSRPADPGGRAFWLEQMANGRRLQSVAAEFYGSIEFFEKVGSTHGAFVEALYVEIQGRASDPGGHAFWVAQLDSKAMTRGQVAAGFYASPESREGRVTGLYRQVLGRDPDAGGLAYWSQQLLSKDDVSLAAELAASDEYFRRAQG